MQACLNVELQLFCAGLEKNSIEYVFKTFCFNQIAKLPNKTRLADLCKLQLSATTKAIWKLANLTLFELDVEKVSGLCDNALRSF